MLHEDAFDAAVGSSDVWRLPTELAGGGILCSGAWKWGQDGHTAVFSLSVLRSTPVGPNRKFANSRYSTKIVPWWRHPLETFSALLALCAGFSPINGDFSAQRPVTRSFDVFFDLHLNKRLSKQSWGWWFEMQSHSLWHHCNAFCFTFVLTIGIFPSFKEMMCKLIMCVKFWKSSTVPTYIVLLCTKIIW